MVPGHFRWPTNSNVPLYLTLADAFGVGVTGKSPTVSIRRYKELLGSMLDNYYWNGSTFQSSPYPFTMTEVDSTNQPGLYVYQWQQALVGLSIQYNVTYIHDTDPVGIAYETHLITNEVYIPETQNDPIIIGPNTVMGQIELVKDGGSGEFDGSKDSLHFLRFGLDRVLGLLHYNSILDLQEYDGNTQLTYARLRVFDGPENVPTSPGGDETTGLEQKYEIRAEYDGPNVVRSFTLKKVL